MKANATVSVRRNAVQNKKARTTGKVCTKKNTGSPLPQASADLPEQQIALDSIVPNDFNPRRNFSEQSLRELADNMTRVGLIHAVTLRPRSDGQATRSYAAKGVFVRPDWRDGRPYGLRSAR